MAFSPQEIGTRTFSRVRTGGVDRVEVADFLAAVARQTQDLQHQLARAHEQIQRLTAEVEAARSDGRGAEGRSGRPSSSPKSASMSSTDQACLPGFQPVSPMRSSTSS